MCKRILKTFFVFLLVLTFIYLHAQDTVTTITVDKIVAPAVGTSVFDTINKAAVLQVEGRKIPDSLLQQLLNDEAFWYANAALQKKEMPQKETSSISNLIQQKWFKTLLWVFIAVSFATILVWYLTSLNIRLFRKRAAAVPAFAHDTMPNDIFSIPYEKSIADAVQQKNYRMAVRLLYLQALANLSMQGIIQFGQDKTNSEYLAQLYHTAYYKDFFKLTRSFEYTWYGQFLLTPTAFEMLQKDFKTFNHQLPH